MFGSISSSDDNKENKAAVASMLEEQGSSAVDRLKLMRQRRKRKSLEKANLNSTNKGSSILASYRFDITDKEPVKALSDSVKERIRLVKYDFDRFGWKILYIRVLHVKIILLTLA